MGGEIKSRRGVYYDLSKSPYEYSTPYGDLLKFSSKKKLEIYTRDVVKELKKLDDVLCRNNLKQYIPREIESLVRRAVYRSFYRIVER